MGVKKPQALILGNTWILHEKDFHLLFLIGSPYFSCTIQVLCLTSDPGTIITHMPQLN